MYEAPLELDELELPPMFGQFPCFCPGWVPGVVVPGVVVPGVVLGVVVGLGVVVEWPLAASATPPPTLSAAATAATATVRTPTNPNLLFDCFHQNRRSWETAQSSLRILSRFHRCGTKTG